MQPWSRSGLCGRSWPSAGAREPGPPRTPSQDRSRHVSRRDFDDHRIGDRRRHGVDDGPRRGDDHPRRGRDPGHDRREPVRDGAGGAVTRHWPEYAIEAACLGLFMLAACVFVTLLGHPLSPARAAIADPTLRRVLVGVAMGLTAIGLIYSPWGQQSGAHMNPSLTLTYLRLGKIAPADAFAYVLAQFAGGFSGVLAARVVLGSAAADAAVNYAATLPGPRGPVPAFLGELAISFGMMTVVLVVSN